MASLNIFLIVEFNSKIAV